MTVPNGIRDNGLPASLLSIVDDRDHSAALRAVTEVGTGPGTSRTIDLRVRAADGTTRLVEATFTPGAVSMVDVTERALLHELVRQWAGALVVVDERDRIRSVNEAVTRLFGAPPNGWISAHRREIVHRVAAACRDDRAARRALTSLGRSRRPRSLRLHLTDGRSVTLDRIPLASRGVQLGSLWHFNDIAAAADHVLATVSHELRSPLTAVLSFAELLADPVLGPLNDNQQGAAEVIARNSKRVLGLVDDMLLLARLEAGQLPLRTRPVDLAALVAESAGDHRLAAQDLGIGLSCRTHPGPPLTGDADRLHQVLDNLVRNALKFTPAGGTVRLCAHHREGTWIVEIADSGIGIPAAELALITRGFARGSNASAIPGNGIGLALCRELVDLHGGSLNIASAVGEGTTVRLELPGGNA